MKVLVVTNNYYPYYDGISIFTQDLVTNLRKKGHEVKQINFDQKFSRSNFSIRDCFYTQATWNNYYSLSDILSFRNLHNPDKGLRNFIFTNLVFRVSTKTINEYKPDVIHIAYPRLFSAIQKTKIPVVYSVYSEEVKNTYPVKKLIKRANAIISISKFTAQLIKRVSPAETKKIRIIPCSIDTQMYLSKSDKLIRQNYIISIARLSNEKNLDTTIKAFAKLPEEIRNKYKYFIVGNGNEMDALSKLIVDLNVQDSVKLLGNLNEKEKILLLQKSKYFILCPRIKHGEQEGFGIVYLEAQAAGLPILTSKIGGIKEAVGEGGIYISNPEDSDEISSSLKTLILDTEISKKLLVEANKRIKKFDHKQWIDTIIKLYEEIIN